jgi:hypothetical protein
VTEVVEHDEGPAALVAVAWKVVVAFLGAWTATPGDANASALPEPSGVPEQSEVAKMETVVSAAAEPATWTVTILDGLDGETLLTVGAAGAGADVCVPAMSPGRAPP